MTTNPRSPTYKKKKTLKINWENSENDLKCFYIFLKIFHISG